MHQEKEIKSKGQGFLEAVFFCQLPSSWPRAPTCFFMLRDRDAHTSNREIVSIMDYSHFPGLRPTFRNKGRFTHVYSLLMIITVVISITLSPGAQFTRVYQPMNRECPANPPTFLSVGPPEEAPSPELLVWLRSSDRLGLILLLVHGETVINLGPVRDCG